MRFDQLKVGMPIKYHNNAQDKRKYDEEDNPNNVRGVVQYVGTSFMMLTSEAGRKFTVTPTEIMLKEVSLFVHKNMEPVTAEVRTRPNDMIGWQGRGMRGTTK